MNPEKGALAFYKNLQPYAYWMVQPPDNYLFKRKYIHGLLHSIVKNIFEAHSISTEHSTIEEILEEVQHMETVQKAINHSYENKLQFWRKILTNEASFAW